MNLKGIVTFIPTPTVKPIVLLVDDDEVLRLILRRTLESSGMDIMEAANGEEALVAIQARKPDAIITDIVMPGMDGVALIRHLGKNPDTATIYIIAMSGTADEAVQSTVLELGASEFFDKSMDLKGLAEKVILVLPNPFTLDAVPTKQE